MHGIADLLVTLAIVCFSVAFAGGFLIRRRPMQSSLGVTALMFTCSVLLFSSDGDWQSAFVLSVLVAALFFIPALIGAALGTGFRLRAEAKDVGSEE